MIRRRHQAIDHRRALAPVRHRPDSGTLNDHRARGSASSRRRSSRCDDQPVDVVMATEIGCPPHRPGAAGPGRAEQPTSRRRGAQAKGRTTGPVADISRRGPQRRVQDLVEHRTLGDLSSERRRTGRRRRRQPDPLRREFARQASGGRATRAAPHDRPQQHSSPAAGIESGREGRSAGQPSARGSCSTRAVAHLTSGRHALVRGQQLPKRFRSARSFSSRNGLAAARRSRPGRRRTRGSDLARVEPTMRPAARIDRPGPAAASGGAGSTTPRRTRTTTSQDSCSRSTDVPSLTIGESARERRNSTLDAPSFRRRW